MVGGVLAALLLALALLGLRHTLNDPDVYWLVASDGAEWIVAPEPRTMRRRAEGEYPAHFSYAFEVERVPSEAWLEYRTFRTGRVWLDDRPLETEMPPASSWQSTRRVDLAPHLAPGPHTLVVEVYNHNSPPALWARCEALGLVTGEGWSVETPNLPFTDAVSAHRFEGPAPLADRFEPSWLALARLSPLLMMIAAAALLVTKRAEGGRDPLRGWTPGRVRWLLMAAVSALGIDNLMHLHWSYGFDVIHHVEYMDFIIMNRSLPLATDGWEMFQAPLYYVASVPLWVALRWLFDVETALSLLRILPMACGVAHIEVARRVMRAAFPERDDLQIFGLVCAALLPMNLLLSQSIGNETTSALLTGLTVLLAVRVLQRESHAPASVAMLGAVWGLALLTKSSALLLAPALVYALLLAAQGSSDSRARALQSAAVGIAILLGSALLICGWFYIRNWVELGSPLHVGWDPSKGLSWWQDPGYRTPEELLRFGTSLVRPISAVHHGFWDGFYSSMFSDAYLSSHVLFEERPPWNYTFMLAGVLLALVPACLMGLGGLGALRIPRSHPDRVALFAAICIATYLAGILYFWLQVPNYSITKASYTTGLAACYGVLAARGYALVGRTSSLRTLLFASITAWGLFAWAAFWVVAS
jgi:hypothetical protein